MDRLLLALLVTLLAAAAGCSKDPCEEGYEKVQKCVKSLDCNAMGPGVSDQCLLEKKKYNLSYTLYLAACRMPSGAPCECEGFELEKWEIVNKCSLSPANLCRCQ